MNCQASEFAYTQGATLHPAPSSICTAAIADGLMTASGGDLVVTAVGPVEQYTGVAYNGIEAVDFAYSPERQQYSFHMYIVGFKTGMLLLDGCKDVEGADFGSEARLADCAAEKPPETCSEHKDDVAVKCTNTLAGVEPEAGTIRIVGPTGTPAESGLGRLQFYNKGFGSVCSDGWNLKAEQVACRQLGYNNVKDKGPGNESCSSIMGQNFCGPEQEKIAAVNFACTGRESFLYECPHAVGDDIYCVHAEDVVIACEGEGDPSGVGAFHREEFIVQKKQFLSPIQLTCFDSLENRQGLMGPPGSMHLVVCPPNCGQV
ncbi:scavenger receptor protein SR2, putative [Eimeria brunetti]|uniref:Scavenger receptor protein SR2, putative n=1 Tax=Eimeria brunetti TaxID=51314 RepID=U6LJ43_9EIME|nr:scavenger receptor protein SR2, putative [Eimeria brunetti]